MKRGTRFSPRVAVVLATMVWVAAGCSDDGPSPDPSGPDDRYVAEPFPNTVILSEEALEALTANEADGTLRFSATPSELAEVAEGQVLLASASPATPRGLLRYVLEVSQGADGLTLKTTEAPIQLAFRKLDLRFARRIDPDVELPTFAPPPAGYPSQRSPLTASIDGKFWPSISVAEDVFNGDGDPSTPLDQVRLLGELSGGVAFEFTLGVDWGDVFDLPGSVKDCVKQLLGGSFDCSLQALMPESKIDFEVELGAEAKLAMEGVAFLGYENEITVARADLPKVPLGPLLFFPRIEVIAGFSGGASSQFSLSTEASVGLKTRVSYSSKSGGQISAPELTHDLSAPVVEAGLSAEAKLRIGPRLIVALYDVAGIYASVYAVGALSADQQRTPCYKLEGGLEGDVGFLIQSPKLPLLGSVTIAEFGKTIAPDKALIDSGACEQPPPAGPSPTGGTPDAAAYANPTFTPWGRVLPEVVDGFPHEGPGAQVEWAQLTPTIDGRLVLSGSDARVLTKLDPSDGRPRWAKRYVADVKWNDTQIPDLLVGRVVNGRDGAMFVVAHPYTVLKLRADGELIWARRFDLGDAYRQSWLRFTDAVADGDGGLVIVGGRGSSHAEPLADLDAWVLRLDGRGAVQWSRRFGAGDWAEAPRRVVGYEDGFVVVGARWLADGARWQGFALRLEGDGAVGWGRSLTADDCDGEERRIYPQALLATSDGDLVFGASGLHKSFNFVVGKLKGDGALAWYEVTRSNAFSHLGPRLTDLVELPGSGYLAAGYYAGGQNREDVLLAQLDGVGKPLWARLYGGKQNPSEPLLRDNNYPALQLTRDGGVVVGAYSESLVDQHSMWLIKVPAKDGALTFGGTTSAATAELTTLEAGTMCLTAAPWAPTSSPLQDAVVPLGVTVESVTLADQPL